MIDESAGRAACFTAGEPAWHGLGINVANAVTARQAIILAHLDWTVEKRKLFAHWGGDGASLEVPNWFATMRTDTNAVLGVVSDQYRVLQNVDAFTFMDEAISEGAAMWETAGALNDGRRVWMLARIPQSVKAMKGDEVNPYALLCSSHDGSLAVHIKPTTVRVVCNNTLTLALSKWEAKSLVIRHTQSLKGKMALARHHLGVIGQKVGTFEKQAQALAKVSMKGTEVTSYVEKFFPTKMKPNFSDGAALLNQIVSAKQNNSNVVSDLLAGHYAETERIAKRNQGILDQIITNYENDPARGTAWGAYNAVSRYADHQKKYESADTRLNSAWFGAGNDLKQEAYAAALALSA
jgi:phage/plasmid-like protein (TIGR03299 family)